jgi:hypothetical protein
MPCELNTQITRSSGVGRLLEPHRHTPSWLVRPALLTPHDQSDEVASIEGAERVDQLYVNRLARRWNSPEIDLMGFHPSRTRHAVVGFRFSGRIAGTPRSERPTAATRYT